MTPTNVMNSQTISTNGKVNGTPLPPRAGRFLRARRPAESRPGGGRQRGGRPGRRAPTAWQRARLFLAAALAVVVADLGTKALASASLQRYRPVEVAHPGVDVAELVVDREVLRLQTQARRVLGDRLLVLAELVEQRAVGVAGEEEVLVQLDRPLEVRDCLVDAIQRGEPPANPTRILQASIAADNKPVPAMPAAPTADADISIDDLNAPLGN